MYQRQTGVKSSKRLSSTEDCESDAETLDATMEEDSSNGGYALNNSSSSNYKKKAAYT